MSPDVLAGWIGGFAGVTGLVASLASLLKVRPETRKTKADATKVIQDASTAWVQGVSQDLGTLRARVAELERNQRTQDVRLRTHERWDEQAVAQLRAQRIKIPDPPPLYPDPTAA